MSGYVAGPSVVYFLFVLLKRSQRFQPFDLTEIKASDGSITAKFVSFGATLTELWVKDKDGKAIDVVLGYDDNVSLDLMPFQ